MNDRDFVFALVGHFLDDEGGWPLSVDPYYEWYPKQMKKFDKLCPWLVILDDGTIVPHDMPDDKTMAEYYKWCRDSVLDEYYKLRDELYDFVRKVDVI